LKKIRFYNLNEENLMNFGKKIGEFLLTTKIPRIKNSKD